MKKVLYDKHSEVCTTVKVEGHSFERALGLAGYFINEERPICWYTKHDENPKLAKVGEAG